MASRAVFAGLVVDENDNPVGVASVGGEAMYVVDDAGFHRHIPSETVDRQVLDSMKNMMEGHEEIISDQTAKMLGQEDPFSRAMIMNQLRNMGEQFDKLLESGIPEEARAYLGMMGFQVIINIHGEVVDLRQPGMAAGPDEEGGD